MEEKQNKTKRRTMTGKIRAMKMAKTVVVEVVYNKKHWLYKKIVRRTRRFLCDNTLPDLTVGDTVVIEQTRPISKNKHFQVIKRSNL